MNEQENKERYTLITGASLGIGRALAFECARRGMNLLLVALPGPDMSKTVEDLKKEFPVKISFFEIDLTEEDAPERVLQYATGNDIRVNILINNAGFGTNGMFERSSLEINNRMMKLNNLAMMGLTHHFIPEVRKNGDAHIMNVSSMEATLPLPYKAVYTGTKNFIYSFSLALYEELKREDIRVSILCPGPVITNEEGLRRYYAQGWKAKLIIKMPEEIARVAIPAMLRGKTIIIPGFLPWLFTKILNFIPELLKMRILERIFRVYKEIPTPKSD